jgi:hypothetical protein
MTEIMLSGSYSAVTIIGGEEIRINTKTKDPVPTLCRELISRGVDPDGLAIVTRDGKPVWKTDRPLWYWAGLSITEEERDGLRWGLRRGGGAVIIHRVEHISGLGPIASGLMNIHSVVASSVKAHGIEVLEDDGHNRTKVAVDDLDQMVSTHHIFGCETMQQLRRWFPSPYGCEAMARFGGILVTYSVPDEHILRGTVHVAFDKRHAVRLNVAGADEIHPGDWSGLFGAGASSPLVELLR